MSLPAWGAWIETSATPQPTKPHPQSLPAWGAWIETVVQWHGALPGLSLPAWGAWIETSSSGVQWSYFSVAPRVGSVD